VKQDSYIYIHIYIYVLNYYFFETQINDNDYCMPDRDVHIITYSSRRNLMYVYTVCSAYCAKRKTSIPFILLKLYVLSGNFQSCNIL
jgi:hypothetical protein